jgi:putative ABC transport system substrate-binding protein
MNRRGFIGSVGGAIAAWPFAARGQTMPVIGCLGGTPAETGGRMRAFRRGLAETGYVEGGNVAIEYRYANGQFDRLPALAAELVRRSVNVLVAGGIPASLAVKPATATIPIVFYVAGDPVQLGLVNSLNRPGGNLTGVTSLGTELSAKRLELARELLPGATAVALLVNPSNPNTDAMIKDGQAAAGSLALDLHVLRATSINEVESAVAAMAGVRGGALVVGNDGLFIGRSEEIAAMALRYAVPMIFQTPEFAVAGGLLSYGSSIADAYHQAGIYTGRILKGENPGELPVVQSAKIELIVNLKTAKAMGIAIPLPLLGRADEVIE